MAGKEPCRCIPTCMKLLGPGQHIHHRQAVEAAPALSSSELDREEHGSGDLGGAGTGSNIDIDCDGVVGRVQHGNEWGIFDHSGDLARTVFIDPEPEDDD
ncbi:hypothetical protein JB92DRAFT_3118618 [Gautieria morchelliformis]|nr:hypothetical protein JB92DRAFT_3118618 [Gautieria morchelliformis]